MAIAQPETEPPIQPAAERVTLRAFVLALITIVGMHYYTINYRAHFMIHFMPPTALLPLVTWIGINLFLRTALPRYALSRTEVLTIFGIVWLPATMPGGVSSYLLSAVAGPAEYSSPENRFWEVGWPHLPQWMFLKPSEYVVGGFWSGLPEGDPIPWAPWIPVLFWWFVAALGMGMTGFFASTLFYRQWLENERLIFPLSKFPSDLLEQSERGRLPDVMKKGVFWIGFACTAGVLFWNIAGYFVLHMPRVPLFDTLGTHVVHIGRGFPAYHLRVHPLLMGLAYHCPLNLLFTFWILYPLDILKQGLMNRIGFSVGLEGQPATPSHISTLEANGALFFLVGWSIWIARHHLKETCRKAFSSRRKADDGAPVSYRTAWLGLFFSGTFMLGLFMSIGFSLPLAIFHALITGAAYFGVTKYSAATGFVFLRPPSAKGHAVVNWLWGTGNMTPGDLSGMAILNNQGFAGGGTARMLSIPATPHFFRLLGDALRRNPLVWGALPVALLTAFVATMGTSIHLSYVEGRLNLSSGPSGWGKFLGMIPVLEGASVTRFDTQKWLVWIFGGAEAGFLTFMMSRFSNWPIHPLGIAFPQFYGFSIFLVWLPKYLIVRYGGVTLFQRSLPFWYGFLVGYLVGVGASTVVDMIWFPTSMHWVHGW